MSDKENDAKAKALEKKLAEDDAREAVAQAETAKLFDVKALAVGTKKTCELNDPDLGLIRYKLLTSSELNALQLSKIANLNERTERVVFAMLRKEDPAITLRDYDAMPGHVKALLLERVVSAAFSLFLQPRQLNGSPPTRKRS